MYFSFLENLEIKVTKLLFNSTYAIENSVINIMAAAIYKMSHDHTYYLRNR